MKDIETRFPKREQKIRRNYEIEDGLYNRFEDLTTIYEATVGDLLNLALELFIKKGQVHLAEKEPNEIIVTHTFKIRESNISGLDTLKDKYGISIYKMVNLAIRDFLKENGN